MLLREEVTALMQDVAATVVMPRFRALAAHEIEEKSPGEIVTIVDREAELRLHDGLAALGLGARIVGEEAVAASPALLDDIGQGLVWLIDPLDGTANFAAGAHPFGMMVALVDNGVPIAGWILDPRSGRLCHAERNLGATCNGIPIRTPSTRRERPIAALGTHFLPPELRDRVHAHAGTRLDIVSVPRCAAESYPRIVLGENDLAMFQRTLPWDHAAGALFVVEAGGVVTDWTGQTYRVGEGVGVLAAIDQRRWDAGAAVLLGREAGLIKTEETLP